MKVCASPRWWLASEEVFCAVRMATLMVFVIQRLWDDPVAWTKGKGNPSFLSWPSLPCTLPHLPSPPSLDQLHRRASGFVFHYGYENRICQKPEVIDQERKDTGGCAWSWGTVGHVDTLMLEPCDRHGDWRRVPQTGGCWRSCLWFPGPSFRQGL